MELHEVERVLAEVAALGVRHWLEGGWGVDALVGRVTRPHRDLDLDVDADREADVLAVLAELGYTVETDWRPNRVELAAAGRGWVDVHPVQLDARGGARQAALDGGWHVFPYGWATLGSLGGRVVPCVSATAQRLFHTGYPLRDVDRHDLALLDGLVDPPG